MKEDSSRKIFGKWWYSNSPQNEFYGELEYGKGKKAILSLVKNLESPSLSSLSKGLNTIHGLTIQGEKISLLICYTTNSSIIPRGLETIKLFCLYVVIGNAYFNSLEEKQIKHLSFGITGLESWFNISGTKINNFELSDNFEFKYEQPTPKTIKINENLSITFSFRSTKPFIIGSGEEWLFKEYVVITLESKNLESFKWFFSQLKIIKDFFTVAFSKHPSIEFINIGLNIQNANSEAEQLEGGCTVILPNSYYDFKEDEIYVHEMLFRYEDIKDALSVALNNWFSVYKKLELVLSHYISSLYSNKIIFEPSFLNIVRALEIFHRRFREGKYISESDFAADVLPVIKSAIPESLHIDFKTSLKKRLQFANEYSLAKRIKEIVREYSSFITPFIPDVTEQIQPIVDHRNYFTHYEDNGSLSSDSLDYQKIFKFIDIIRFILDICFLNIMNLSEEKIQELLNKNHFYKRKLKF